MSFYYDNFEDNQEQLSRSKSSKSRTPRAQSEWFLDEDGVTTFWYEKLFFNLYGIPEETYNKILIDRLHAGFFILWIVFSIFFIAEAWFIYLYDNCGAPALWPESPWFIDLG